MCPMLYYETFKTRHQDLVREGERQRLIKSILDSQPKSRGKGQSKVGEYLNRFSGHFKTISSSQSSPINSLNGSR